MSDAPKFTPGPWHCTAKHSRQVSDARGFKIAKCLLKTKGANFEISVQEAEANARLIAAAPEMYEALLHAQANMPHPDQMIDAAIAKAEGRS